MLNFCSKIASGAGKAGFIYTIREMVSHIEEHRKALKSTDIQNICMILFHQMKVTSNSSIGKNMSLQTESVTNLTKLGSKLGVALKKA